LPIRNTASCRSATPLLFSLPRNWL
jgi:hypothetical protein